LNPFYALEGTPISAPAGAGHVVDINWQGFVHCGEPTIRSGIGKYRMEGICCIACGGVIEAEQHETALCIVDADNARS